MQEFRRIIHAKDIARMKDQTTLIIGGFDICQKLQ